MAPLNRNQKKRRRRSDTWYLLLLILAHCHTTADAEDRSSSSQNQNAQVTYSKNHGVLNVQKYCRRKDVVVTSARLTCDSPGAYYYGSKTYRGSEVCIDGDKASLKIHCKSTTRIASGTGSSVKISCSHFFSALFRLPRSVTIADDFDSSNSIYVQIESGVYNKYRRVVGPTNLCQMQIQPAEGYNQACPRPGDYVLQSQFYIPQTIPDNDDFHFTPDVNLTFTDGNYNRLGCAVTGTTALHLQAERRHRIGMLALSIGLFVFGVVMGGLLLLAYRRRKRLETLTERKTPRYQYFRTLPNGQVVPIQGHPTTTPPPPPPQHMLPPTQAPYNMPPGAAQEAFHISNPAYNETQLPTRPVI